MEIRRVGDAARQLLPSDSTAATAVPVASGDAALCRPPYSVNMAAAENLAEELASTLAAGRTWLLPGKTLKEGDLTFVSEWKSGKILGSCVREVYEQGRGAGQTTGCVGMVHVSHQLHETNQSTCSPHCSRIDRSVARCLCR